MKIIDNILRANRPLLTFEHGLGDFVCFLPVFEELKKQTKKNILLASSAKRQFKLLYPSLIISEEITNRRMYDYYYSVIYPDSTNSIPPIELHNEPAKPYLCGLYELGMKDFTWKPFKLINKWKDDRVIKKRIGVHLFGHTGMAKKFCPNNVVEMIWNEIEEAGYHPFEVHMIPKFSNEYSREDRGYDDWLPMLNENNSLRFEDPDLKRMIQEIDKCDLFIGIDSGPIYLASTLIGCDRIVGLTNKKRHDHFLPKHISTINVENYRQGSIKRVIKQKDIFL